MTTCTTVPSAAWSLDRLVSSLQSHGWGELDGPENAGLQKVMTALESLLPWESAEGQLTRAQVADAAGMTPKWAGHCLRRLEQLGVITWRRGWLDHGRPRAGWIRVLKHRLAEMCRAVRGYLDARRAQRRIDTHERLQKTLRQRTVPPWKLHRPLSRRGELSSTLPTQGSTPRSAGAFQQPSPTLPGINGDTMTDCQVCGRPEHQCRIADARLPLRAQHEFTPGRTARNVLVTPAHVRTPDKHQAPRGWRASARAAMHPAPSLFEDEQ
jgi:hypothetical protein